jgi:hypothetical protein
LGEFVAQVCQIRQDWTVPENKELWFRGEKQDYGPTRLRPTLYRPPGSRRLKPVSDLLQIEDDLFETFQRCNTQLAETATIDDDFDGYLFMQHHGGPTRLLDWSDGSRMALHFALRNKQDDESDSPVYVLASPDGSPRPFELPRIPMLLRFSHFSRRTAAQRSQLIVFGSDPSWLSDEANRPDSSICMIVIDGSRTKAIRAELRECGVTESVIFPDLDGLGRELNQIWQDRQ